MLARPPSTKTAPPPRRRSSALDAAPAPATPRTRAAQKRAPASLAWSAKAEPLQLVDDIRARLHAGDARRVGLHHAIVLLTLRGMPGGEADVTSIYKSLVDNGHSMVMTRLYRTLKVLEDTGMLYRHWMLHEGRPRSTYRLIGEDGAADAGEHVCAHCGAAIARR
ncbi:helix-turn-helix transcriptional regulator [Variovorax sp. KK3]|uniref:helix-turn-helix transcriptional regulator n=1 Tax=Variovorax sp. KK3 TaxID=1855728 RepID=UPI00097C68EF|nr:helix-turn-helix transcriptional regulator [Variovorax sp. KK3]